VKLGASYFAPLAFNAVRIALASALLLGAAWLLREPMPDRRTIRTLLLLGVLGNGVYQVLFIEAISRTRSANVAIVLASAPAMMALAGRVTGREFLGGRALLGIGVSLAGITLVVLGGAAAATPGGSIAGDLLALCAVASWVTYSLLLKPYTERVAPVTMSAVTMVGGAVPLALIAVPQLLDVTWGAIAWRGWAAVGYAGVLAVALGYLAWYRGLRVLGPTRTAMYGNLQPVVALAVGALLVHEPPTAWQILGASGTMLGLVLVRS
jgi:drug/metabolite transporter (DMT)-like permease